MNNAPYQPSKIDRLARISPFTTEPQPHTPESPPTSPKTAMLARRTYTSLSLRQQTEVQRSKPAATEPDLVSPPTSIGSHTTTTTLRDREREREDKRWAGRKIKLIRTNSTSSWPDYHYSPLPTTDPAEEEPTFIYWNLKGNPVPSQVDLTTARGNLYTKPAPPKPQPRAQRPPPLVPVVYGPGDWILLPKPQAERIAAPAVRAAGQGSAKGKGKAPVRPTRQCPVIPIVYGNTWSLCHNARWTPATATASAPRPGQQSNGDGTGTGKAKAKVQAIPSPQTPTPAQLRLRAILSITTTRPCPDQTPKSTSTASTSPIDEKSTSPTSASSSSNSRKQPSRLAVLNERMAASNFAFATRDRRNAIVPPSEEDDDWSILAEMAPLQRQPRSTGLPREKSRGADVRCFDAQRCEAVVPISWDEEEGEGWCCAVGEVESGVECGCRL